MASLPTILLILAALSMGATVIAVIVAFRSQKEADTAIFPIVREEQIIGHSAPAFLFLFGWLLLPSFLVAGWLPCA